MAVSLPPAALLHVLRDKQGRSCLCQANVLVIPGPGALTGCISAFSVGFLHGSNHRILWHQHLEDGIKAPPKGSQGIAVSLWLLLNRAIVGKTRTLFSKAFVCNCCQLFLSIIIKEKPSPPPPLENATQTLKKIHQSQEKQQQYCLTHQDCYSCRLVFLLT